MQWNTFDGWQENGYCVIKGEKSVLRCPISGLPLFNNDQVREMRSHDYDYQDDLVYYDEYWKN